MPTRTHVSRVGCPRKEERSLSAETAIGTPRRVLYIESGRVGVARRGSVTPRARAEQCVERAGMLLQAARGATRWSSARAARCRSTRASGGPRRCRRRSARWGPWGCGPCPPRPAPRPPSTGAPHDTAPHASALHTPRSTSCERFACPHHPQPAFQRNLSSNLFSSIDCFVRSSFLVPVMFMMANEAHISHLSRSVLWVDDRRRR